MSKHLQHVRITLIEYRQGDEQPVFESYAHNSDCDRTDDEGIEYLAQKGGGTKFFVNVQNADLSQGQLVYLTNEQHSLIVSCLKDLADVYRQRNPQFNAQIKELVEVFEPAE